MSGIINCPHCDITIEVVQLNCQIFRCGIYKNTLKQIDPHLPKEQCDELKEKDLIYGCGKPFRVNVVNKEYKSVICDYI
jgi:hypothetical protein